MMGLSPRPPAPEDRISAAAPSSAGGGRLWWALCSLFFHGTALAAVLIAAAGEGPELPPPSIEVTVVTAAAPSGAAAARSKPVKAAPAPSEAAPVRPEPQRIQRAEPDLVAELASIEESRARDDKAEAVELDPDSDPLPVAEAAPIPSAAPPPPPRKPDPPKQPEQTEARVAAPSKPASAEPMQTAAAAVPPAQLAALPNGDSSDSAAVPGAGISEPPRYEAGGKANPWPRYPAAARRRGIDGEVLVEVAVGIDGKAERVEVLRSSGNSLLDRAAVEALARWRFEPARAAGQPVAGTVQIPVTFRLTDSSE